MDRVAGSLRDCRGGRASTSAALSPPKPNDVDRIRSYDPSRPSRTRLGRRAASSGSGSSRLTVPGTQPSATARLAIAASSAPVAPSGWPVSAFVAETGTVDARSPRPATMARASAMSPIGVELAWALTQSISSGATPASASARVTARPASRPSARGWTMWCASDVAA